MNKLNRVMLMLIAMAAIMLLAVGIDKGLQRHEKKNVGNKKRSRL